MPGTFRPIFVGTIFAKFIEKILKNRFIQFFNISNSQYGFQKESSTIGAACDLIEEIIKKNENWPPRSSSICGLLKGLRCRRSRHSPSKT